MEHKQGIVHCELVGCHSHASLTCLKSCFGTFWLWPSTAQW